MNKLFLLFGLLLTAVVSTITDSDVCCVTVPTVNLVTVDCDLNESPECLFCEYLVTQLKEELVDFTQEAFVEDLHSICNLLPTETDTCPIDSPRPGDSDYETCPVGGPQDECNEMVDELGPLIYQILTNADPEAVCQLVQFC